MWDYSLTNGQIITLLKSGTEMEKKWLIGKIITHARFDDVWQYISPEELSKILPTLRIPEKQKKIWENALKVWGYIV